MNQLVFNYLDQQYRELSVKHRNINKESHEVFFIQAQIEAVVNIISFYRKMLIRMYFLKQIVYTTLIKLNIVKLSLPGPSEELKPQTTPKLSLATNELQPNVPSKNQ